MTLPAIVAALLGLAMAVLLVWTQGPAAIGRLLVDAGWGVLLIAAFRVVPLALDAWAWNHLWDPPERRPFGFILRARWICESINTLLPVAQVGGDVARARLSGLPFRRRGEDEARPGAGGGATTLVDYILGQFSQVLFIMLGLGLLAGLQLKGRGAETVLGWPIIAGMAAAGILILWLLLALRRNAISGVTQWMRRSEAGFLNRLGTGAERLDGGVAAVLGQRRRCLAALAIKGSAWFARAAEIWILLWLLDAPLGLAEIVVIEAIAGAVRSAGFLVPGALGVQEGGIFFIGTLLGLPPEIAVALALMRRAREIVTSVPGLFAWSHAERGALARVLGRQDAPPGSAGADR
ncbi:MAG: flippase-like domain-containing protein [Alphaproteobacteria bacterium]|nr:flippase-like domain-containing protein [Alphaproteobacteria bacterium]